MVFVTGPLYAGKKEYISRVLNLTPEELASQAVWDVQEMVKGPDFSDESLSGKGVTEDEELVKLADELSTHRIVIETETGGGLVPADAVQRKYRERAGRLSCLLAERADCVIEVYCGLGQILKGELPC